MPMLQKLNVGVLALQGDFERHLYRLDALHASGREVRSNVDLDGLDGLIIPGGESTTISLLIDRFGMRKRLGQFCSNKGVWGTCAGMIMLAEDADDPRITPLGIIDITVSRNAFGRQIYSFHSPVLADLNGGKVELQASFIRAPIVTEHGRNVRVLAMLNNSPILLSQRNCLVSSFHTELGDDLCLTKYFLENFVEVYKQGQPQARIA